MKTIVAKQEKKPCDENYWTLVLIYFASFLMGLGIVSEIMFNWDTISDSLKLGGAFAAMVINASALIWAIKAQKQVLKQVLACVYAFLIMGVIGLVGQVFQLKTGFSDVCLLWSCVSFPLFMAAPRLLWLWLPLWLIGINGDVWKSYSLFSEFVRTFPGIGFNEVAYMPRFVTIAGCLCLFGAYEIWVIRKQSPQDAVAAKPLRFWSAAALYGIYSQTVFLLYNIQFSEPDALKNVLAVFLQTVPYLIFAGFVWILNKRYNRKSFMPWFLGGLLFEFLLVCLLKATSSDGWYHLTVETTLPLVFVILMTIYACNHKLTGLCCVCGCLLSVWFLAIWSENFWDMTPILILCGAWAYAAYKMKSRRLFSAVMLVAAVRILGYYADADDLRFFGMLLIVGGALLLAMVLLLKKCGNLFAQR